MAEFPGFGRHCSFLGCHQLDFLPIRCDACSKNYCASHYSYINHSCDSASQKNVQVPVCPLCHKPVPVARGEVPDERVGQHIDTDCRSDPALASKGKIYTNRCSMHGCRKKELVPIQCKECAMNFCISHRFPADHECTPRRVSSEGGVFSMAARAAMARFTRQKSTENKPKVSASSRPSQQTPFDNGTLTEDEALARALQASLTNATEDDQLTREQMDAALAEQLQRNEYAGQPRAQRVNSGSGSSDKCSLS